MEKPKKLRRHWGAIISTREGKWGEHCGTGLAERKRRGNIGALSSLQVISYSSEPGHGLIKIYDT